MGHEEGGTAADIGWLGQWSQPVPSIHCQPDFRKESPYAGHVGVLREEVALTRCQLSRVTSEDGLEFFV